MALTITVAVLSISDIAVTGFYPGIVVLFFVALIPIASKVYARNRIRKPQGNYYTSITIINLLSILVVLWMTFVILVDRVFSKVL